MLFIDAHVHIYNGFPLQNLFEVAQSNFLKYTAKFRSTVSGLTHQNVLIVTRSTSEKELGQIIFGRDSGYAIEGAWYFKKTAERDSVVAQRKDGYEIIVVAGSQIVTQEKIEVLVLACGKIYPDGLALNDLLTMIENDGHIAVLPWGFGKWWGRRGQIVDAAIQFYGSRRGFFLGDNAGRTSWLPYPRQFKIARERNIAILPGSDPFPFKNSYVKIGTFGFCVDGQLSHQQPAQDLQDILYQSEPHAISCFGQLTSVLRFSINQVLIQLKNKALHFI
jgi:hypothetical protein